MQSNSIKNNTFKKASKGQEKKSKPKANGNIILQQNLKDSLSSFKKNKYSFETSLKQGREEYNQWKSITSFSKLI